MGRGSVLARVLAVAACAAVAVGCDGDGGHDDASGLTVSMTSNSPPPGGNVVWIAEGGRGEDLLLVDILARDVTGPFDAFEVEIEFDPTLLEARSTEDGGALAACTSLPVLHTDNIGNGGAASGRLLLSSVSTEPPGTTECSVAGTRSLARILFVAIGAGTSTLDFVPFNSDPNNPLGSRLFSTGAGHPVAAVTFFDSQATVTGTR